MGTETLSKDVDTLCGMMQLALKESGIDFKNSKLDVECAKKAIEFAIETNEKAGILTGRYDRILTSLNNL